MNLEDFYTAVQDGKFDVNRLTVFVDGNRFYVIDDQRKEVVAGHERDLLEAFFKILGIKVEEV